MLNTAATVLCFGDSNTHGTRPMRGFRDVGRFPEGERWPGVARSILSGRAQIIEAGHPGRTTLYENRSGGGNRSGLTSLGIYLESNCPIDCVVLMLGTNDLHAHYGLCAQVVAWNLAQLIELIQQSPCGPDGGQTAQILVVSPPHVNEQGFAAGAMANAAGKSRDLASHYSELAEHYGVAFLDAALIVSPHPLDGIHLDAEAHTKLGAAIAEKLDTILGLGG